MLRTLSTAAIAAFLAVPAFACDGFGVEDAYIRTSTPRAQSGAAFMTLHNQGDADCRLVGARTPAAEVAQLHTHQIGADGVARMTEVEDGFAIPAGGTHGLERGGDHLMLMGLPEPLTQGQMVEMTFVFEDGSEYTTEIVVDSERAPGAMGAGHGAMHGHGN